MKQQLAKKFPFLGEGIQATPPDVEDALIR